MHAVQTKPRPVFPLKSFQRALGPPQREQHDFVTPQSWPLQDGYGDQPWGSFVQRNRLLLKPFDATARLGFWNDCGKDMNDHDSGRLQPALEAIIFSRQCFVPKI